MKMKPKMIAIISLCILTMFPFSYKIYEDGGTKTYTSLIYKIILWDEIEGKQGMELRLFPNNFYGLNY